MFIAYIYSRERTENIVQPDYPDWFVCANLKVRADDFFPGIFEATVHHHFAGSRIIREVVAPKYRFSASTLE